MKKNNNVLPWCVCLLLGFAQCGEKESESLDRDKGLGLDDVMIDYNETALSEKVLRRDTVVIVFLSGFNGERVEVAVGSEKVFSKNIHTDDNGDMADYVLLPNASRISSFSVKIGNKQSLEIKLDSLQRMFGVDYLNEEVQTQRIISVKSYARTPRFD